MITTRKSSRFPRGRLLRLHVIVFLRCSKLASTENGTLCTSEHNACPEDMLILVKPGLCSQRHRPAGLEEHFGWPKTGRDAGGVGAGAPGHSRRPARSAISNHPCKDKHCQQQPSRSYGEFTPCENRFPVRWLQAGRSKASVSPLTRSVT